MKKNIFLTKWSEISGNRWDPLYHSGAVKGFFKRMNYKKLPLKELVYLMQSGKSAGKKEQSNKNEGILQIRPTNIDNFGLLKLERNIYVPKNKKFPIIEKFDILFNNTNSQELVGKTLYIDKEIYATYSNHITRIVVDKNNIEPMFLWIILNLYQEQKIFYNICTNWNNQSGVGLEILEQLPIPLPPKEDDNNIQNKIIKKMQNAYKEKEKAEKQAKKLLNSIDKYILKELGIELPKIEEKDIKQRVFIRKWSEVSGNRWDSEYYSSKYYIKHLILNKQKNLVILKDIATIFQGVSKNEVKWSSFILLKVKNILSGNSIDYNNVEFIKDVPKEKLLLKGDIITPFIGEAIKQFKFSVFDNLENKYTVDNNTGIIRINKQNVEPNYVCEILNSVLVRWQIEQQIGGGGMPFIGASGAKKIKIPLPNIDKQRKIVNHIHKMREEAKKLKEQALQNLEDTKKEIEKMLLKEENDI